MKKILITFFFASILLGAAAQNKIYNEKADAMRQIDSATTVAKQNGKYVLCQVGGNWCPWCLRFAQFADTNNAVHSVIDKNFVYVHINYSPANKNPEAMRRLANPARFGFPVFVILDGEGNVLHIQNSAYLEEGKGYSPKKVEEFLLNWTPLAVKTLK